MASDAHRKPRVLLLDLDGTLIGRVGSLVCEHDIVRLVSATAASSSGAAGGKKVKGRGAAAATRAYRESVVSRLRYGIIRPHFEAFCKSAAVAGGAIELFVYTASDTEWAGFLVPCVEAALGVRFNRPIFTRAQCSPAPEHKKSVARVAPAVFRALKKKPAYAAGLRNVRDLDGCVALVDNTPNVLASAAEAPRLLVCPTYAYQYVYDVLSNVGVDAMHRRFARLVPVLVRSGLFPADVNAAAVGSYQQFAALYYDRLARTLSETRAANVAALAHDRFWVRLLHALARCRDFSDESMRMLSRRLASTPLQQQQQQQQQQQSRS